jgi:hypothetical protein
LASACEGLFPGYQAVRTRQVRVLKGIIFDETLASEYVLDLKELQREALESELVLEGVIWSRTAPGQVRYHYRATVILLRRVPDAPRYGGMDLRENEQAVEGAVLYRNGTLFHGPSFQGVTRVLNISPRKVTALCTAPTVEAAVQGQFPARTYDPYQTDTQFQTMLIWARAYRGAGALPLTVGQAESFRKISPGTQYFTSMDVVRSGGNSLVVDIAAHDADGLIYTRGSSAEVTISEGLNHLFQEAVTR